MIYENLPTGYPVIYKGWPYAQYEMKFIRYVLDAHSGCTFADVSHKYERSRMFGRAKECDITPLCYNGVFRLFFNGKVSRECILWAVRNVR